MNYYILTVGYSLSGKSFLVSKILEKYPKRFFVSHTRDIHDFLSKYTTFIDDWTVEGEAFKLRNEVADEIKRAFLKVLPKYGINIIQDSCNLEKKDRKERIDLVKGLNPETKIIIIYVNSDEKELIERIKKEDQILVDAGRVPNWMPLFEKQKEKFEKPTADECDYLIEYDGKDFQKVILELEKIV